MKSYKVYRKNGQVVKVQAEREGITPEGFLVFEQLNPVDPNGRNVSTVFKEWEYYEVIPSNEDKMLQETMKLSKETLKLMQEPQPSQMKLVEESKDENHSADLR